MWPEFLHKYFGFNKQQGRGLFVLVLGCILLFLLRLVLPLFEPEPEILIQNLPLLKISESGRDSEKTKVGSFESSTHHFPFNPNQVTFEQLLKLGFKKSSAKALVKFREKGFVFRKKEDLLKVYGVDQILFNRLSPFIVLAQKPDQQTSLDELKVKSEPAVSKSDRKIRVELNGADSLALLAIPGIGPSFSKRIIKYKALLGGFYKVEQLLEVYGFNTEMFQTIAPYVYVDPGLIRKLNINRADFKTINRHPYLSYEQTKSIVKARDKAQLDSIGFRLLLNDEALYQQLRPYCAFD